MYNFRILIQEIQLVRDPLGSVFLLHVAQPSRDVYQDQPGGGGGGGRAPGPPWRGAPARIQFSRSPWARVATSLQGGALFKKQV